MRGEKGRQEKGRRAGGKKGRKRGEEKERERNVSVPVPGDCHVEVTHLPSAGKGKEPSVSMGFCWLVCFLVKLLATAFTLMVSLIKKVFFFFF